MMMAGNFEKVDSEKVRDGVVAAHWYISGWHEPLNVVRPGVFARLCVSMQKLLQL